MKERGILNDSKGFSLSNWLVMVLFPEMGNIVKEVVKN